MKETDLEELDVELTNKSPFVDVSCMWLKEQEYGGLELTVEAELFYTPGRSYFTPPDGQGCIVVLL